MILTSLECTAQDEQYPAGIREAIAYLRNHKNDIPHMEPGDYPIDGNNIYAKIFDVVTQEKETTHPEIHKKYVDVQYWATGQEFMGYAPAVSDPQIIEAQEENDLYFLSDAPGERFLEAQQGDIMILFPGDIHRPAIQRNGPMCCRKTVVKVSVDLIYK